MEGTPQNGETATNAELKNNASTTTPTVDPSEVERLRKEAEQATMRANQLANQLKAKEEAEASARARELEEENKFKELYEAEKAKRETIEAQRAEAERQSTLRAEAAKVLGEYPEQVRQVAEKTGLSLSDTDEASVEAFKAKLSDIAQLIPQAKVTANNPGNREPRKAELNSVDMHTMLNDPVKFEEYLRQNTQGISSMLRKTE